MHLVLAGGWWTTTIVAITLSRVNVVFLADASNLIVLKTTNVVDGVIQISCITILTVSHVELVEVIWTMNYGVSGVILSCVWTVLNRMKVMVSRGLMWVTSVSIIREIWRT